MSLFSRENQALYFHTVSDLLAQPGVQRLRRIPHHRHVNRFDHVLLELSTALPASFYKEEPKKSKSYPASPEQ